MSVPTRPVVVRAAAVDWVKFDAELARDGSVDPVDKALYAALASFVGADDREADDDPDSPDVPTRKRLAACIGRSVDTVDRATKRLEARGLLDVERRRDPDNPRRNIPSVYRLLDGERWDERAAERAAERLARRKAQSGGGRTDAAGVAAPVRPGVAAPVRRVPLSKKKEENSSPPLPSGAESAPEPADPAGREDEAPPELERAQSLVDAAVRRWPSSHRAPGPRDRQRLSERVVRELAAGGDEATITDELTRDLNDAASAVRVVLGARTRTPGWGRPADPRPASARFTVRGPRPAWCGRCDERTRLVMAVREDGSEAMRRCRECHPAADPLAAL